MGVAASFALFATTLALGAPAPTACPQAHPCHHVLHVGPSTSPTSHASWDSAQLFAEVPIAVVVNYSPQLPYDTGMRTEPIASCGLHFWVNGRFNGVATRCGPGLAPLHVQVANVYRRHLRVGITYWVPQPQFTG